MRVYYVFVGKSSAAKLANEMHRAYGKAIPIQPGKRVNVCVNANLIETYRYPRVSVISSFSVNTISGFCIRNICVALDIDKNNAPYYFDKCIVKNAMNYVGAILSFFLRSYRN